MVPPVPGPPTREDRKRPGRHPIRPVFAALAILRERSSLRGRHSHASAGIAAGMSGKAERVGYSDYAESTDPRDDAMFNRVREEVADVGVAALAGIQAKGPLQGLTPRARFQPRTV